MKQYYLCPKCKSEMLLPACGSCGYELPLINSIYRFYEGAPVKLEGSRKYIGYDDIGEDFEPEITYWNANNTERYSHLARFLSISLLEHKKTDK